MHVPSNTYATAAVDPTMGKKKSRENRLQLKLPLLPGADASRANPFDNRPEQLTFESNYLNYHPEQLH